MLDELAPSQRAEQHGTWTLVRCQHFDREQAAAILNRARPLLEAGLRAASLARLRRYLPRSAAGWNIVVGNLDADLEDTACFFEFRDSRTGRSVLFFKGTCRRAVRTARKPARPEAADRSDSN